MAREYFCAYHSLFESLTPYGDAEVGRLFRACLQYSMSREEPKLSGNERFIWPTLKLWIDRDIDAYNATCGKNKENGQKGGRPKRPEENRPVFQEVEKNRPVFSETQKSQDKDEDEDEDKDKDEDKDDVLSSSDDDDNTARVRANPVVAAYCKKISAVPSTACISELVGFSERLGEELCLRAIDIALDANARNWPYVKAILQRWQDAGYKTLADVDRAEAARQRRKGKALDEGGDKNAWMDEFVK